MQPLHTENIKIIAILIKLLRGVSIPSHPLNAGLDLLDK